jgi:hypothetical protein
MTDKLIPCPFCGGKLKIIKSVRNQLSNYGYDLICTNEWDEGEDKVVTNCPLGGYGFLDRKKLVRLANMRYEEIKK